ncbi:MAG TPA: GTP cyclohydrolase II RibA [Actinomycetes bacterium]|jgi:3,4-dihydroxy 2-butanone 4-phosphate synthase/GTP cyclohydrolase II|nr:GTP cyclohydrolase II RibA [Actinomycetes bacterium]
MAPPEEVARLSLPTWAGEFDLRAFQGASGEVYLLLSHGDIGDGHDLLVRVHSGCLTGDTLGSLRCDCGPQLRLAMRRIVADGRGVLLYAAGHEGRGVGLVSKLQAYMLQDQGHDTVEANQRLGLPVDGRDYREVAQVLLAAGIRSARLLTNNPDKARALQRGGIRVEDLVPLQTAPHLRNHRYVETKRRRLGHRAPGGEPLAGDASLDGQDKALDATRLLGDVHSLGNRPYVVLKYAQTLDGRIATRDGDSKWISGPQERRVSHAMRAACDAVVVGAGTVLADDPLLTVRMVPGASPIRVVLDSTLIVPPDAQVFGPAAATIVLTSERSQPERREALRRRGVKVEVVRQAPDGIDLTSGLARLLALGIRSLLVEGGARVITSMLRERLVDRVVVAVAPILLGRGTEAVGDLGTNLVADGLRLLNRTVHELGSDLLLAGDLDWAGRGMG